jgi:hypothetical protein
MHGWLSATANKLDCSKRFWRYNLATIQLIFAIKQGLIIYLKPLTRDPRVGVHYKVASQSRNYNGLSIYYYQHAKNVRIGYCSGFCLMTSLSSRPYVHPSPPSDLNEEDVQIPEFGNLAHEYVSPAEAEKALRDLMGGGINQDLDMEVDIADAIVPGFQEGIQLLPHQILGRFWMKQREDVSLKRTGGILADDMGFGLIVCISFTFLMPTQSWKNYPNPHSNRGRPRSNLG